MYLFGNSPYTKCIFVAFMLLMRKFIVVLILFVLPLALSAQTRTINLFWADASPTPTNRATGTIAAGTKSTEDGILNLHLGPGEPVYITQWEDSNFADPNSITISNIKYGPISSGELNKIEKELIPNQLTYSIATTQAREILYTILNISPVVRNNGSYQKLISFTVDYRYGPQRRNDPPGITNSVLASGRWFKFKVEKTGIHKIDKAFLNNMGMNTDGINPRNLKVYGNGGQTLPLLNIRNTIFDLPENAIQVIGEEDGSFDGGDYILFYGTNTEGYVQDNDSNLNPYSDDSYYYVTVDGGPGKRVQAMTEPSGQVDHIITQFDDYQFYEKDEFSPTKLGRRWYGDRFDIKNEQHFEFSFPNIVADQPMRLSMRAAAASESETSMAITINGVSLTPMVFSRLSEGNILSERVINTTIPAGGETVTLDMAYNNSGNPSSIAYLDYINIEARRQLQGVEGQLAFRYKDAAFLTGVGEYQIGNAAQFSQVWDVTDPYFITNKVNEGNASSIAFKQPMGKKREYVAINPNNYFTPVKIANSSVGNQDLKGTIFKDESGAFKDVDYIIITAPFLIQPALRLANHHKNLQGLNVKVVTTDRIYEEFSSGKQDIGAIRNFIRYVYYNASDPSKRIKYVGIMGDASIDYKSRLYNNNNIVPTFNVVSGTSESNSFMSDDFFGNMDPNEGTIGGAS